MKNTIIITKLDDDNYNIKGFKKEEVILNDNSLTLIKKYINLISQNIDNFKITNGSLRVDFADYSELVIVDFLNIRNDKIFEPLCKEISRIIKKRKIKKNISKASKKLIVPAMFITLVGVKLNSKDDIVGYNDKYNTVKGVIEEENNILFTDIENDKVEISFINDMINDSINISVIEDNYNNSQSVYISNDELTNYDDIAMKEAEKSDFLVSALPYINDYISKFGTNMYDVRLDTTRNDWKYTIEKYCNRYGFDTDLCIALVAQESGGISSNIPNKYGDIGLTQNHYESWVGKTLSVNEYDEYGNMDTSNLTITYSTLTNPDGNVQVGVAILQYCIEKFNGNIYAALLSYNMGEGNVRSILNEYANDVGKTLDEVMNDNYDYGWFKYIPKYAMFGDDNYLNNVFQFFNKEEMNYKCNGQDITVYVNKNKKIDYENDQIKGTTR